MTPKAPLTSHSRMSGSRWVIISSWLSGLWRSFLYSSSVYYCYLFLISSASVRFIPFPLGSYQKWYEPIFMNPSLLHPSLLKYSLCISHFLEEISSLSLFIIFLYFFALITDKAFLISPCSSSQLCIQMDISFLSPLFFASLLFTAACKSSSDNHFAFFAFLFLGDGLDPCLLYNVTDLCS